MKTKIFKNVNPKDKGRGWRESSRHLEFLYAEGPCRFFGRSVYYQTGSQPSMVCRTVFSYSKLIQQKQCLIDLLSNPKANWFVNKLIQFNASKAQPYLMSHKKMYGMYLRQLFPKIDPLKTPRKWTHSPFLRILEHPNSRPLPIASLHSTLISGLLVLVICHPKKSETSNGRYNRNGICN